MINTPIWASLLLMLPVVFATALVSSSMRHPDEAVALKKALKLSGLICLGIVALSILSLCVHYLFCGGVAWE